MNILVVGSGGREHALCWAIKKSPLCASLFCAPGNAGIADVAKCLDVQSDDIAGLISLCSEKSINFVIVGPELPLSLGLVDQLRAKGVSCFGPTRAAAEIESSKGFMKDLAAEANVPTAAYQKFTDPNAAKAYATAMGAPIVIKADGLAAGKGVTIARTLDEAFRAVDDAIVARIFGNSGTSIVIEEFMEGEEVSFFALCDGVTAVPFSNAQDHKAAYDGDKGPNTGGMGAYSPAPMMDGVTEQLVMDTIIHPTVRHMQKTGRPFTGVLFAGLMMTKTGPRLIEFNARFGDPETEVIVPRLKTDLLALLYAASKGMLDAVSIEWLDKIALGVIIAAEGYPGTYKKDTLIKRLDEAVSLPDTLIFHAGTRRGLAGDVRAIGGRVLCVTATGATIEQAQKRAYQAVDMIDWPEGFCRRDIGWRAISP